MALSAQPSEWSVDTGITHNIENIAIFRGIHDEVKDIVVHMDHIDDKEPAKDRHSIILNVIFVAVVFASLGNKVFQKLETIPFYNYPNFVNLFMNFLYIIMAFVYIIPLQRSGISITPEMVATPKRVFMIIGTMDAIAGSLQIAGATVVAAGIFIVLIPTMGKERATVLLWSIVLVISCVPMVLSSIYKEIVLGHKEMDAIFLLGWTVVFQFLFSIPLTLPLAAVGDPSVPPSKYLANLWGGLKCFVGINTITGEGGGHPDDCLPWAPLYFMMYIVFNIVFNVLIVFMLKFGSATTLFLALTISVPLGNMVFALPFVPGHTPIRTEDIFGLVLICLGLYGFRFGRSDVDNEDGDEMGLKSNLEQPLLNLNGSSEVCTIFNDQPST